MKVAEFDVVVEGLSERDPLMLWVWLHEMLPVGDVVEVSDSDRLPLSDTDGVEESLRLSDVLWLWLSEPLRLLDAEQDDDDVALGVDDSLNDELPLVVNDTDSDVLSLNDGDAVAETDGLNVAVSVPDMERDIENVSDGDNEKD